MRQAKTNQPQLNNNLFRDHLALNITRRCNQRCVFCFEGDRKGWDELSIEKISRLVKEAVENGITNLIFMGAEALLRKDIVDIIRLCKSIGIKHISAFTNGQVFAREEFVEQIVNAGLDEISLSFHYADSISFERYTGTDKRFFDRLLVGMSNIEKFNTGKRGKKLMVSTETLLFIGNENRLCEILNIISNTIPESLRGVGFKRIQRTNVNSDFYLLDDIENRRRELSEVLKKNTFIKNRIYFTRVPLCMIPGFEHLSTDLNYSLRDSKVMANFIDKQRVGEMHDYFNDFFIDPFKDICIECSFLGLCPMGSSTYENKAFFPYESQRPTPSKKDVRKIIRKIAKDSIEFDFMYRNYLSINSFLKKEYQKNRA